MDIDSHVVVSGAGDMESLHDHSDCFQQRTPRLNDPLVYVDFTWVSI